MKTRQNKRGGKKVCVKDGKIIDATKKWFSSEYNKCSAETSTGLFSWGSNPLSGLFSKSSPPVPPSQGFSPSYPQVPPSQGFSPSYPQVPSDPQGFSPSYPQVPSNPQGFPPSSPVSYPPSGSFGGRRSRRSKKSRRRRSRR